MSGQIPASPAELLELPDPVRAAVRAHVVDVDDLDVTPVCVEDPDQLGPEQGKVLLLIDHGQDDRELARRDGKVRHVRFARHVGLTAALDAGYRRARVPIVVTMDSDLQSDPADIQCRGLPGT